MALKKTPSSVSQEPHTNPAGHRTPDQPHPQSPEAPKTKWWKSKRTRLTVMIVAGVAFVGILIYLIFVGPYVTTDDARIEADIIRVANAGMGGPITHIWVQEGDAVTNGMLLAELDHRMAESQLESAQANFDLASKELARNLALAQQQGISQQQLDRARSTAQMAEASLQIAQIALDRTYIRSPVNGIVIQKLAIIGNILEANQSAFVVSDVDHAWVSANVPETVTKRITIGARVTIHVDEGNNLFGSVATIRRAAASVSALMPVDNASGNFIKVVQRIPLKISLDPHERIKLRVGQSVEIRIRAK